MEILFEMENAGKKLKIHRQFLGNSDIFLVSHFFDERLVNTDGSEIFWTFLNNIY